MRLTSAEIETIVSKAREVFGSDARVSLFGSRLDDEKRGGDIDLLIELAQPLDMDEMLERRSRFVAKVWRVLGERKIDVVVSSGRGATGNPAFLRAVRRQAQPLAVSE